MPADELLIFLNEDPPENMQVFVLRRRRDWMIFHCFDFVITFEWMSVNEMQEWCLENDLVLAPILVDTYSVRDPTDVVRDFREAENAETLMVEPETFEEPPEPSEEPETAAPIASVIEGETEAESLERQWEGLLKKRSERQPRKLLQVMRNRKHFDIVSRGKREDLSMAAYGHTDGEPDRADREFWELKSLGYIDARRGVGSWLTDMGRKLAEADVRRRWARRSEKGE